MPREIRFYRTVEGECPVEAFLDALPAKTAAKVVSVFRLVAQQPTLSKRFLRKLHGSDLYEIRILHSKQAYRFPCFFAGESPVVLTHGFVKKTEKTPARELQRAQRYRDEL